MKSFLSAQASEFRHGYQVKNDTGPASRAMQKRLIVEEFKEFLDSGLNEQSPSLKRTATAGRPLSKRLSQKDLMSQLLSRMQDSPRFYSVPIMTSTPSPSNYGPPPPIVELTIEQQFKMRQIEDALKNEESAKEDIITIFLALQKQNFVLSNSLTNLLKNWPKPTQLDPTTIDEVLSKFGISSETKDWVSTWVMPSNTSAVLVTKMTVLQIFVKLSTTYRTN